MELNTKPCLSPIQLAASTIVGNAIYERFAIERMFNILVNYLRSQDISSILDSIRKSRRTEDFVKFKI